MWCRHKVGCVGAYGKKMGADGCIRIYQHGESAKQYKNIHKCERRVIFDSACTWQQNKVNFGLAKKSDGEDNKDNFGQLSIAKDLICKFQERNYTQP